MMKVFHTIFAVVLFIWSSSAVAAQEINVVAQENKFPRLDTFGSGSGDLEVTLIVENRTVQIGGMKVLTHVYTTCLGLVIDYDTCADQSPEAYAGPRLRISQGNRLRIRLVNRAAPILGAPMELVTNLHTHGLLVRARGLEDVDQLPEDADNGYLANSIGDFIYVLARSENVISGEHSGHAASPIVGTELLFDILIPEDHPLGIFWFHPHPHGWSKEQVSGGMAGMIEVVPSETKAHSPTEEEIIPAHLCLELDNPADPDKGCKRPLTAADDFGIRSILLKDSQITDVLYDGSGEPVSGTMFFDQAPGFCNVNLSKISDKGFCTGQNGRWIFSVNGRTVPEWNANPPRTRGEDGNPIPTGNAEILRIQNASANVTFNLCFRGGGFIVDPEKITQDSPGKPCEKALPFQVLSMDGVAYGSNLSSADKKFVTPGDLQRRVVLMPGSRIEILLQPRDPDNCNENDCPVIAQPQEVHFPVEMVNLPYVTGGDNWPGVKLAKINFKTAPSPKIVALQTASLRGSDAKAMPPSQAVPESLTFAPDNNNSLCRSGQAHTLKEGERRRVYFAIVDDNGTERFLLGHTRIDKNGVEKSEEQKKIILRPFDGSTKAADLCVLPDFNNENYSEDWELVNISEEVHNFHIHQGKFSIKTDDQGKPVLTTRNNWDKVNVANAIVSGGEVETNLVHDTVIVPRAANCKTTVFDENGKGDTEYLKKLEGDVAKFQFTPNKECDVAKDAGSITVRIPFNKSYSRGKYVFHCHILEHEDAGMMAAIRLLTPDQGTAFQGQNN